LQKRENTEPFDFPLEGAETARAGECDAVVEQARRLLDEACVHLSPEAPRGVDPVGRLQSLRAKRFASRAEFYRALLAVFSEFGDRHTHCRLPPPYTGAAAFLPLLVREFFDGGRRRIAVVRSAVGELRRGDTLLSWNGSTIDELIRTQMPLRLGANEEARRAKVVQTLTVRPLVSIAPPDEKGVLLECIGEDGRRREVRLAWQVCEVSQLDSVFAPPPGGRGEKKEETGRAQATPFIDARPLETSRGVFGYIRVASFQEPPAAFLASFTASLESLPPDGVVIDLRGCEDGVVPTAEQVLQLFTTQTIEPQPFQFRLTELIRRLVNDCPALYEWRDAVEAAARRGESYSGWRPLTSPEKANCVGRKYRGAVVVVVDALTYSSAEMLAAGFQDHGVGCVLGTAGRTGGGGASAWHQETLFKLSGSESFRPLPSAPIFRVAVRRCARVRRNEGRLLEGAGVVPDVIHRPTRADIFHDDEELWERAGKILAENGDQR
jgi:hypothetical protein